MDGQLSVRNSFKIDMRLLCRSFKYTFYKVVCKLLYPAQFAFARNARLVSRWEVNVQYIYVSVHQEAFLPTLGLFIRNPFNMEGKVLNHRCWVLSSNPTKCGWLLNDVPKGREVYRVVSTGINPIGRSFQL